MRVTARALDIQNERFRIGQAALDGGGELRGSGHVLREALPAVVRFARHDHRLAAEGHLQPGGRRVEKSEVALLHQRIRARQVVGSDHHHVRREVGK